MPTQMSELRQHYEERCAKDDPYDLGLPENRFALQRGLAGVALEERLTSDWEVRCALDVGCGDWGFFHQVPRLIGSQLAVAGDIALAAVKKARQRSRSPDVTFVVFDAQHLPFRANSFDMVHCVEVLEHLPDAHLALGEIERVATGHVLLSVPNEQLVGKMDPEHLQTFGYDSFLEAVRSAELDIKHVRGTYFFSRHISDRRLRMVPLSQWFFRLLVKLGEFLPKHSLRIVVVCESNTKEELPE